MNTSSPLRVLVADEHPCVREGWISLLSRQPDMRAVAQATSGQETLALYGLHRPDLVITALRMPDMRGVDAIRRLRKMDQEARILVLASYDGDEDIHRAVSAGAKGYLLKNSSCEQLLQAIREVACGHKYLTPSAADKLAQRTRWKGLTPRELEVLRRIAEGKSNQQIAGNLSISEGTVKSHVNNILSKMGASDRTQAVVEAIRRGLLYLS